MRILFAIFLLTITCACRAQGSDHLYPVGWFGVYEYRDTDKFINDENGRDITELARFLGYTASQPNMLSVMVYRNDTTGKCYVESRENNPDKPRLTVELPGDVATAIQKAYLSVLRETRNDLQESSQPEPVDGPKLFFASAGLVGAMSNPSSGSRPEELLEMTNLLKALTTVGSSDQNATIEKIVALARKLSG